MKVEEEAKSKEMEDLYLPPRSRKTLQPSGPDDARGKKRRKEGDDSEENDEDSESDMDGSDEERPKKRGRPRTMPRENIKSFTDVEVSCFTLPQTLLKKSTEC